LFEEGLYGGVVVVGGGSLLSAGLATDHVTEEFEEDEVEYSQGKYNPSSNDNNQSHVIQHLVTIYLTIGGLDFLAKLFFSL